MEPPKEDARIEKSTISWSPDAAKPALGGDGLSPGKSLPSGKQIDQFAILDLIGSGGMGEVYRACHVMLKKTVAIKVLLPELIGDQPATVRFRREIQIVSSLNHPNIVRFENTGVVSGVPYLVMEYVPGIDLEKIIRQLGPLPIAESCQLVGQAAVGLEHAHRAGLVHRDVKPSNLMLSSSGALKVLDLGVAVLVEGSLAPLKASQYFIGAAEYLAPEQTRDPRAVDARSDIYSLGCTLLKVLTGQPPFARARYASVQELARAHTSEPPPSLTILRPDTPPGLAELVARMLAKNPDERPRSMAEVARALAPCAEGCDIRALMSRVELSPLPLSSSELSPVDTAKYLLSASTPTERKPRAASGRSGKKPKPAPRPISKRQLPILLGGILLLVVGVLIGFFGKGLLPQKKGGPTAPDLVVGKGPATVRLLVSSSQGQTTEVNGFLVDSSGLVVTTAVLVATKK